MMTAGCRRSLFALLLPCVLLAGCRRNDLVESELRKKEAILRETTEDLHRAESRSAALERELAAFRQGAPGLPVLPPDLAGPTFGLRRITLGRGTGGYDNDSLPGDESLQVIVEPRDGDDHVVKVPGSLHITAIEISPQGLKRPLCWWAYTPEQLRPHWKQGLLSTGYSVVLPWTVFPHCETVRVVVQFKLADGRCFETDKDVKVRPLPLGAAPSPDLPAAALPGPAMLNWSPAPLSGAVEISRPRPLSDPATPILPQLPAPLDPLPLLK